MIPLDGRGGFPEGQAAHLARRSILTVKECAVGALLLHLELGAIVVVGRVAYQAFVTLRVVFYVQANRTCPVTVIDADALALEIQGGGGAPHLAAHAAGGGPWRLGGVSAVPLTLSVTKKQ